MNHDDYLKTKHWQRVRKRALKRADNHCQLCNSVYDLNAHHNSYERIGRERKSDVVVLCMRCHKHYHGIMPSTAGNIPPIGDLANLRKVLHINHAGS